MSNGDFWPQSTWKMFNGDPSAPPPTAGIPPRPTAGLLRTTMGPMEVAQQVFPTVITGNDNSIPADTINPATGVATTGVTRAFATLQYPFQLAPVQVSDPALTIAINQVTLAAQGLALTEDNLFFNGQNAILPLRPLPGPRPPLVTVPPGDPAKLNDGLMRIARDNLRLPVQPVAARTWGINTYNQVLRGLRQFQADTQGPPYALILAPDVFVDVNLYFAIAGTPTTMTPASIIQPLLASGPLVQSAGLLAQQGLLASLGGKTTTLYIGSGPLLEFNTYSSSVYSFTARESIQFVNVDTRSLIMLDFQ